MHRVAGRDIALTHASKLLLEQHLCIARGTDALIEYYQSFQTSSD